MPATPTPEELAQWTLEAHVRDMGNLLPSDEYDRILDHVGAVHIEMDTRQLLLTLNAMTDLATEFAYEIVRRDESAEQALSLLRDGRRLWAARATPKHPAEIGQLPAAGMAELLARTAIQEHQKDGWSDYEEHLFDDHLDELEHRLDRTPRHQVALIDSYLHRYESGLNRGQANPPLGHVARLPLRAGCVKAVWARYRSISTEAETLHQRSGTLDEAWALLKQVTHPPGSTPS